MMGLYVPSPGFSRLPALLTVSIGPHRNTHLNFCTELHLFLLLWDNASRVWTLFLSTRPPARRQSANFPGLVKTLEEKTKVILALVSQCEPLALLALALKQSNKKLGCPHWAKRKSSPWKERPSCRSGRLYVGNWDLAFVSA